MRAAHVSLAKFSAAATLSVGLLFGAVNVPAPAWSQPAATARHLKTGVVNVYTHNGVQKFSVEIADDDASRELGLMFRKSMPLNHGMFFIFDHAAEQNFWMKNCYFPQDMLFIGADGRVISVTRNAPPMSEALIQSYGPALYVLELNAGLADKLGIDVGTSVELRR